jgi:hypothetical protein
LPLMYRWRLGEAEDEWVIPSELDY